jgi:hypothetical protein
MRAVNNELFAGFSREDIQAMDSLMRRFALNGEHAMEVIQAVEAQRK